MRAAGLHVRRRDIPKVLLASAAGTARAGEQATTTDLRKVLQQPGAVRIPTGTHELASKLQTLVQNNISGDSRHDSILKPADFRDYVLEVGDGKLNPNAGKIERLRFYGAAGNLGCLHLGMLCHMWHLDDLLFSGGPCPALVVDNCWDANFTNIDILGHVTTGNDPAQTAAVIFRNGTANIYCRGLRIEGARSGGLYVDSGPNYVTTGKIDDGFGRPQSAAAITVTATGTLILEDFYLGGMSNQFHIEVAGALRMGRVALDGGSNSPAAILDRRAWTHINAQTSPGVAGQHFGPFIPGLDLGEAQFHRSHPSVNTTTEAAVFSRIHPVRQVRHLAVVANAAVREGVRIVATSLRPTHADTYKNSFLVNNASGERCRILGSHLDGALVLAGGAAITPGADWSIEYCERHATPLRHQGAWLAPGQTLFAVVARALSLVGPLTYVAAADDLAYGTTKFRLIGDTIAPGQDLAGLFLVNEASGSAYYIEYGIDIQGFVGILYDRRSSLQVTTNTYSVIAGYVETTAANLAQTTAAGGAVVPDLSVTRDFEIEVAAGAPLTIVNPVATPAPATGRRITFTLVNTTSGPLGDVHWGSAYKLAAWSSPAPGHSRSIEFRYNGKDWIEIARTPADVPN